MRCRKIKNCGQKKRYLSVMIGIVVEKWGENFWECWKNNIAEYDIRLWMSQKEDTIN